VSTGGGEILDGKDRNCVRYGDHAWSLEIACSLFLRIYFSRSNPIVLPHDLQLLDFAPSSGCPVNNWHLRG